jgi:hypothetical protein
MSLRPLRRLVHLPFCAGLVACQVPFFDIAVWVLDLAGAPGMRCSMLAAATASPWGTAERRVNAVGCDLSPGVLRGAARPALVNADVTAFKRSTPHSGYPSPDQPCRSAASNRRQGRRAAATPSTPRSTALSVR